MLKNYKLDFEYIPQAGTRIGTPLYNGRQPLEFAAAKIAAADWIAGLKLAGYLDASAKTTEVITEIDPDAAPADLAPPIANIHGQLFEHVSTFDCVDKGKSTHRRIELYRGFYAQEAWCAHRVDQILRDFLDPIVKIAADSPELTGAFVGTPVS